MTDFVPPTLDTSAFTRDQLAWLAEHLAALVRRFVAMNLAHVERAMPAIGAGGPVDQAAAVAAFEAFAADMNAVQEVHRAAVAAFFGQVGASVH